ncbi:MAG: pyridoxal phosphate-dependent aminotransferase [Gammaproteobacteria bacterium]|jgi:alanine-synthesizing transaminase|nr:pyridoxal phosphate-dependent aminotransferase [Gammaproteobacteria bacterium]MBT3859475.1 pyridoxal phosphate-dependent aminotransferase [Gammaproteobacteria bacterium]MBT3988306.1 pyridoxal phosphate-dependent aminotransferase [Gammaproteobacteria bacterium]MBT4254995.1 pyridoxal phosphate-dependent aminotransferase [Gammaproteobacteria bacterium]MBT4581376.1 pyridoxal phosphate-dependent aminotransferase [Gammaproteobacteria bacterium]
MKSIEQSHKLDNVCYDIRGPVLEEAKRLEEEGHRILKLNIGNPAPFGFNAPDEILQDVIHNLANAQGYCDSKGLFSARKAIMQECQRLQIPNIEIEDIYLGNGVSELITMSMQALLNNDDEVLIPAPDYPLWTASVSLAGGNPVHYVCDEGSDWFPDIEDIKSKIGPKTRALVLINPNNPTGAVYSREILLELIDVARQNDLILFADEIYSKIVYDDAEFIPLASLCDDVFIVSFNGLSKSYRLAGFRAGWMILSGPRNQARNYIEGLEILTNMRLCANVPAQYAIQTALGGFQSINQLVLPGGRLKQQRDTCWELITSIPGVSCVKPQGAIYMFPKLDPEVYKIEDDMALVLDILNQEQILLVQGSAFNIDDTNHLRLVFLPREDELSEAVGKIAKVLEQYR